MKTFMEWVALKEDNQNIQLPNPPSNQLQQYYVDSLLKLYKPQTVISINSTPEFYSPQRMYKNILESLYKFLRVPNAKEGEHYDDVPHELDIDKVTSQPTQLVQVKNEGGWHYRMPHSFSQHPRAQFRIPSTEKEGRISIAALANKQLIGILDDYVANKRLAYYKTPDSSDLWTERHDPITMYFKEPVTPEVKAEVARIMNNKDFNRAMHKANPLSGDKFAPGVAQETSPEKADIQKAIAKIAQINPQAGQAAQTYLTNRSGEMKASAGQMDVMQKFDKLLELEKKPINNPQQGTQTPTAPPQTQQPQQPQTAPQQPQAGQPFSLSTLADKVGDVNWHTVYDAFARRIRINPKSPETQKMGLALYQAAQTNDMSHIKDYVDQYARAQRV